MAAPVVLLDAEFQPPTQIGRFDMRRTRAERRRRRRPAGRGAKPRVILPGGPRSPCGDHRALPELATLVLVALQNAAGVHQVLSELATLVLVALVRCRIQEAIPHLAGMILAHCGYVPGIGEHFSTGGYRLEAIDRDGQRIERLWISRKAPAAKSE